MKQKPMPITLSRRGTSDTAGGRAAPVDIILNAVQGPRHDQAGFRAAKELNALSRSDIATRDRTNQTLSVMPRIHERRKHVFRQLHGDDME